MPKTPSLRLAAATVLAVTALAAPTAAQEAPREGMSQEPQKIEVPVHDATATSVQVEHKRVPVPSLSRQKDQPFTIEIPVNWEVRRDVASVGVFLGPPSGDPNSHPEMLLFRESDVGLDAPLATIENLRANARTADWSLEEAEIRDFGGVDGLWIVRKMPPTGLHGQRMSFAVKLPLGEQSLDVLATVPLEQNDALAPAIRHMLLSIRSAEAAAPGSDG